MLDVVQDLFPEKASYNTIAKDGNAAAETFLVNEKDQPHDPEGDFRNKDPSQEALEVSIQAPFVISLETSKPLVITTRAKNVSFMVSIN